MVEFEWNDAKANLINESMVFHLLKPQPSFKMSLPVLCQIRIIQLMSKDTYC